MASVAKSDKYLRKYLYRFFKVFSQKTEEEGILSIFKKEAYITNGIRQIDQA